MSEIESAGFTDECHPPFKWVYDIEGYYFKSDGKTIEWLSDSGYKRKPLKITNIKRFKALIKSLIG